LCFEKEVCDRNNKLQCLKVIGEAVKQLPEDFKKSHSSIEWRKIVDIGFLITAFFTSKIKLEKEEIMWQRQ